MSLDPDELVSVAERFGVADEQVQRDHAISHMLAALARTAADHVVFFGGTALSRTHLMNLRLSEDIDLIAIGPRTEAARAVTNAFDAGPVRRELGRITWRPDLGVARGSAAAVAITATGHAVKVQLLSGQGYPSWPSELVPIQQRYSDVPAASLRVLTRDAFAASKLSAWIDRRTSRDLYDLWAMVGAGMITTGAADLFCRLGQRTRVPERAVIAVEPSDDWVTALGGQTRIAIDQGSAADVVANAWSAVRQ
ncbi:nucleotidyl transferase AbiEii/AbiGii toxin family protein [Cellulomonas cellasea]|uniref:Nucleotidyl transferase AbiEii/AbiGii toxin family protein n=2 Tax=Cellulomonas cellasea TaxID=43670 RepID=A0A0A0BCY5_9CELL|nr:nucleotidyl transferase AbiEii/AbiGii toxin family protein [Cellulomonas cellasea]KGM03206.1 hypothetical protein Q760_08600 [Cellulomonas cellasea DSM 20118]GEA89795.1 hypothetical protein CCE01nite_37440 [Cellulomonas cellasea]